MRCSTTILLLCFLGAATLVSGLGFGRKQSAGIRGQLRCHGEPATNIKIKLYDDDRGSL